MSARLLRHGLLLLLCTAGYAATARAQSPDDGFDPGANAAIRALAIQTDGKIVIGGDFTMLGGGGSGTIARSHIARLNVDGSVDLTFDPGANGPVYALAIQPDGKIVVGGNFSILDGFAHRNLGRLGSDGAIDVTFNRGPDGSVNALALQPDGKILLAGSFTTTSGFPNLYNRLARLHPDGSVDNSLSLEVRGAVYCMVLLPDGNIVVGGAFTALDRTPRSYIGEVSKDGAVTAFDPGANAPVRAFATELDGSILVGGEFTTLGGGGSGTALRRHIGRLTNKGALDPTYDPGATDTVWSFARQRDGKLVVAGAFTGVGGGTGSTARAHIGRINPDGSVDDGFDPGANGTVFALALQDDAKIIVGGDFAQLGGGASGSVARASIGRVHSDGSLDDTLDQSLDGAVNAMAVQADGKIVIGGAFTSVGGVTRLHIARLNLDGSLDATFDPAANGDVDAIAIQSDGKIIIGGAFTALGATPLAHLARVNSDGTPDATFVQGTDGPVYAVFPWDGKILVGGSFTTLAGMPHANLGRLNADGTIDGSYNPSTDGPVESIADWGSIIAGSFSAVNGTPRQSLAFVAGDGALSSTYFTAGANAGVHVVLSQPDEGVLVGGCFTTLAGAARNRIGRVSLTGELDTLFDGAGADDCVRTIALQTDGKILVGGAFTTLAGAPRRFIGRLKHDGSLDSSFDPGANGIVNAVVVAQDGKSVAGGAFTMLGGSTGTTPRSRVGRLSQTDPVIERTTFAADNNNGLHEMVTTLHWTRGGTSPAIYRPEFQISYDGVTYTPFSHQNVVGAKAGQIEPAPDGWKQIRLSLPLNSYYYVRLVGPYTSGRSPYTGSRGETVVREYLSCPEKVVLPPATAGVPYSPSLTYPGTIGTPRVYLDSGNLPAGLAFEDGAGVMSGTPTQVGHFTLTFSIYDDYSRCTWFPSWTDSVTLTVSCPAIALSATAFPAGTVHTTYTATAITQTGGIGTASYAVTSGALPAGLSLSTAGVVSGTPSASGTFAFTVTATDVNGCTGSRGYNLTIGAPPTMALSPGSLNFGALSAGSGPLVLQTPAQALTLTQTGSGVVTWQAAADQPWISVSPASGTGGGTVTVSVIPNAPGLPASGRLAGTVTVTTTGAANTPSAAVQLTIELQGTNTAPVGMIDTPADGQSGIAGALPVTGWAVDDLGATRVQIFRDAVAAAGEAAGTEVYIGDAVFVTGARPDVEAAYPTSPYNGRAGWGYMLLTPMLPSQGNGTFILSAYADDIDGNRTRLGARTITCANATSTQPFGTIDTPAQGGTVSGTEYLNFGWVLTPLPGRIPLDGSTIQVWIDSVPIGPVDSYNNAREDIQAAFPGYANTDGAVAVKFIDTTVLANGVHTIAWTVTDDLGHTEGIGSRFFTVANSSGGNLTAARASTASSLGPASALTETPESLAAVPVLRGLDDTAAVEWLEPDRDRIYAMRVAPLERIQMDLSVLARGTDVRYQGYAIVREELRDLPAGSTLDDVTGHFTWAPGLGFGGTHTFVFIATTPRGPIRITVHITIANSV